MVNAPSGRDAASAVLWMDDEVDEALVRLLSDEAFRVEGDHDRRGGPSGGS